MNQELVSEASNRARQLINEGKQDAVSGFMKIGAGFCLVAEHKLNRLENLTMAQYIASTGMSYAKAHQAMSVFKKFGHLNTTGILHSRLIALSSVKMEDDKKQEVIDQVRDLGPRDFDRYLAEKKGKAIPAECKHEEQVTICKICNTRLP